MKLRRIIALVLIVLGAVLLLLAPAKITTLGIALIVVAVLIEAIGIYLERSRV